MSEVAPTRPSGRRLGRQIQERAEAWLFRGQDLILIGVAFVMLLAGLVVIFDAGRELLDAIAERSIAEAIFSIVENALLALILAELVHTLLVGLGGRAIRPEPFIVIGIVAITRKMLLTTVLAPKATDGSQLLSPLLAELLTLGALTLMLVACLVMLRFRGSADVDSSPGDGHN
jgi:uncharacterized membrane protein (DUF373 family)